MRERITRQFRRLSLENMAPETIALSIVLGLMLGVFPMYGGPTVLCVIATLLLRPHVPLLHAINAVTSPLQVALAVPFHMVGNCVLRGYTGAPPQGRWSYLAAFYGITSRMITGWLLVCLPLGIGLYVGLAFALRRRSRISAV